MSHLLFDYPAQASVGSTLPKRKLYQQAKAGARLKEHFVAQVDKIIWQFKLAPTTINLPASPAVPEVQVFRISLKGEQLHHDVLGCIDTAIPLPIIFELEAGDKVRTMACHKRPSDADSDKHTCSDYFGSEWQAADGQRQPLPVALDMGSMYQQLLQCLLPTTPRADEPFDAQIARAEQIAQGERELQRIETRLRKEKQFNRRIAINTELKQLKAEIERLKR